MKKPLFLFSFAAAVLLGLTLGFARWLKGGSAPSVTASAVAAPVDVDLRLLEVIQTWDEPQAVDSRNYAYRLPGMACLVNPHGIRRKVIVMQQNTHCASQPGVSAPVGPRLRFFLSYFVFEVSRRRARSAFTRLVRRRSATRSSAGSSLPPSPPGARAWAPCIDLVPAAARWRCWSIKAPRHSGN